MKLNGKKISDSNIEICVIPRSNGENVVFHAAAVTDMSNFEKLCERPNPPQKLLKGGKRIDDYESPSYIAQVNEYATKRMSYMILKSLTATPGLEWETIDLSDPDTWDNYSKELNDSGFTDIEIMRINNTVMTANCLNEDRLREARDDFLASQQAKSLESSSPKEENPSTPSGEPAKELESGPQMSQDLGIR